MNSYFEFVLFVWHLHDLSILLCLWFSFFGTKMFNQLNLCHLFFIVLWEELPPIDPIPTTLLKTFYGFFEEQLLNIINYSLQMGVFPTSFKTAVVRPLLKKSKLHPNILNNSWPVSNLPFLSKILEKLSKLFFKYKQYFREISIWF